MTGARTRTICWTPIDHAGRPGVGCEHLLLGDLTADSVVLAVDDDHGPFRLHYHLTWDSRWRLHTAEVDVVREGFSRSLNLRPDSQGRWLNEAGEVIAALDGCVDIDLWPTPFTNSFPIKRQPLRIGERREFRMAWIFGPDVSVRASPQAYTRLDEYRYRFESGDGSGFQVDVTVDGDGIVRDYPGLFRRQV